MTRKPGALRGRVAGDERTAAHRNRRHRQKDSLASGDDFGAGLEMDAEGRWAIRKIPRIDAADPDALEKLFAYMRERGDME